MHTGKALAPRFWERLVNRFGALYVARKSPEDLWILCCRYCAENNLPLGRASWSWEERWKFLEDNYIIYKEKKMPTTHFLVDGTPRAEGVSRLLAEKEKKETEKKETLSHD